LVLRLKPRNGCGDFEAQTVATSFEAQTGKPKATNFEAKLGETIATGFEAKPGETVPVVLRPNH
jgi:hypothetical protein